MPMIDRFDLIFVVKDSQNESELREYVYEKNESSH